MHVEEAKNRSLGPQFSLSAGVLSSRRSAHGEKLNSYLGTSFSKVKMLAPSSFLGTWKKIKEMGQL